MTEWRTRPRTGKSQFYPLMQDIQARIALGETYRQIHNDLTQREQIEIGYDQFARYIRNHLKAAPIKPVPSTKPSEPQLKTHAPDHPFNFLQQKAADGDRRRNNDDFHSSVPDHDKIYGPSTNEGD